MSVGSDRYYRHKTGFTDGTKYVIRSIDDTLKCVKADKVADAGAWIPAMNKYANWIEITKEEAEAIK
jgi:hypothetical protein